MSPSRCAPVSHGVRLGNRLGVSRGVRPGSPPSELCVCVSLYVCVCVCSISLTTTSRAHWQAEVNKMDGVDSNYEFNAHLESIENKYIHRNYDGRDQNEHLTFYIPLSLLFSPFPSLSLSLSGVGTAAGYMKTIHHCIFTIKLLTERKARSYIGCVLQGWTKRKKSCIGGNMKT